MRRCQKWLGSLIEKGLEYGKKKVLEAEASGSLPKYGRLIVVCGMARTGTSATASFISTHPSVKMVVGGGLWYVAETDIMKGDEVSWGSIDYLLRKYPLHRILIKQPWIESNAGFFEKAEGASVVICKRDLENLLYSWVKTDMVGRECKHHPVKVYDRYEAYQNYLIRLGALEVWPERDGSSMAWDLSKHLRLSFDGFDLSRMDKQWMNKDEKTWLEENALWDDRL